MKLYPPVDPFEDGMLDVGDGNRVALCQRADVRRRDHDPTCRDRLPSSLVATGPMLSRPADWRAGG